MLFALILLAPSSDSLARWEDVRPSIQEIHLTGWGTTPIELTEEINVVYVNHTLSGDSLRWVAEDLVDRLSALGVTANAHDIASDVYVDSLCNQEPAAKQILIAPFTSDIDNAFAQSENVYYHMGEWRSNAEEYRIWAQDSDPLHTIFNNPCLIAVIWAKNYRSVLYGVTTFVNALDSSGAGLSLQPGLIKDYPIFPRRVIGEQYDLRASGPWTSAVNHANGILDAAKDVLLESKGNGFVQYGAVNGLNTTNILLMDSLFERLHDGNPTDANPGSWDDLGMDWYQGINSWGGTFALKPRQNKSAQVVKKCAFGDTITVSNTLHVEVIPIPLESVVPNGDFEAVTGVNFDKWEDDVNWRQQGVAGSHYAQYENLGSGNTTIISNYWHLQDSVGLPIRQMVLEFLVKTLNGGAVEVWVESVLPPDSNGLSGIPDTVASDYRLFDIRRHDRPSMFKDTVESSAWDTLQAVFYTYGLKVDHGTIKFRNISGGPVTINLDQVRIYDSETYFVHMLSDSNGRARAPWIEGTLDSCNGDPLLTISFEDSNDSGLLPRWRNMLQTVDCDPNTVKHHGRLLLSQNALGGRSPISLRFDTCRTVNLLFHAACPRALPAFFDDLNPLGWFDDPGGSGSYCERTKSAFYVYDNDPELYGPTIGANLHIVDSLWSASGPETSISGYFNRSNEHRFSGWSLLDKQLAEDSGWTQAGVYGHFNSEIIRAINDTLPTNRPMLLFADMFSPVHSGRLISRANNPFELDGYTRPDTTINGLDPEQSIVFVDWWVKEVGEGGDSSIHADALFNGFSELPNPENNNWEVMFAFLPEDGVSDIEYARRLEVYRDIARACSARTERGFRFSGGGVMYDSRDPMSTNWQEILDRIEVLQMWWKPTPITIPTTSIDDFIVASDSIVGASFRSYPVPYPEDREANIDSVVFQYRFGNNTTSWSKHKVAFQSDSTYDFSISLPDSGGYVEYRVWSFDDLGRYGSFPPYGAKWTDPEAGERFNFTFERRKDETIVKPDTFWLPGVISKEHIVAPNGKLVFQPLPGYKHATLYVADGAKVKTTWAGTGTERPSIEFNGTDTSYIHVKPLCDTCIWLGIFDSVGVVVKKNVTFHEGTGEALVLKDATGDSKAEFQSAAYEDTVVVKGPAEITGTVTFNKLIVEPGATLSILPGSEISFFEGGQLIVKEGGHLKAFGNDTTAIVFKAAVDSLPWEGIHCEADNQTAACSLKYVQVSGAVAGLLLDRARGYVENCTFENNKFGVLANNGAWFEAKTCSLTTNEVGVVATNLSSVELNDVFVGSNTGPGLKGLSRASFYLEDCVINENNGDGLAGGIGLYTGSSLFMECTEVDANTGSGITAYSGTVMLTSVKTVGDSLWQWQGNRIEHNATIPYEGQITLRNRVALALWNGNNCIWDTTGAGKLVHWEDQVGSDRWADVYWGSTDTAAIKAKLPSSVTLVRIDSSRTVCPTFTADNTVNDSLVHKFLFPHNAELSAQYTRADSGYKAIIRNAQSSDYAFTSCDRLLLTNLLDNKPFGAVVDTMEVLFGNVSDASLKRWLSNTKAWACAEQENFAKCQGILDSLATYTPVRFDRVAARVQVQMAEIRELRVDTTSEYKASDCIAYLDSAQKILEMMKVWNQTTISDSVVMYAPTTVEGEIMIAQPNGRLTILPHPSAEDPTIRFRGAGSIVVQGYDTQFLRGRLYVQGEADNRVNLDWDSTTAWINIESRRGYINMEHANLKGKGWVNLNEDIFETTRTPIFYADSCTFTGFEDGMWLHGVHDSCLISNCTFESMGGNAGGYSGQGSGLSIAMSDGIQFENCRFVNNDEYGIWTYDCDDILFNELEVSGSGSHGLMAWNSNNITIDCGDFDNNGDTLAEIWVEDGLINLVDGYSHIADSNGLLIYSGHPSYTDIEDGENGLELYTSSGTYLKSGDTTAVWDITYNAWAPLIPTAGGFFNKLYPSNPAKWTVDSSLANFIECGGGGGSSIGGQDLIVIGQDETSGTLSTNDGDLTAKRSFDVKADGTTKTGLVAKSSANQDHHSELTQWRAFREQSDIKGNRRVAIDLGKKFIDENPNSTLIPAAVVQLAALAKRAGSKANLSAYLEQKATGTKDPSLRALFNRKSLVARAYEGDPVSGLSGLEKLAGSSVSRRDSICALADAVGIYQAFKSTNDLNPSLAFVKTESLPEFKARIRDLSMQLDGAETVHGVESNAIPTSYALYQNYPNPFNPSTDIRFDLPEAIRVELKIFNILGQEVVTLVDDVRAAGAYKVLWDGKNAAGIYAASGVYVYQIKTPNFQDAKKMVLIK